MNRITATIAAAAYIVVAGTTTIGATADPVDTAIGHHAINVEAMETGARVREDDIEAAFQTAALA